MHAGGGLSFSNESTNTSAYDEYISDPKKPVPFTAEIRMGAGKEYMIEDQRFAAFRPDVLVYETTILEKDITISGAIAANLFVSSTGTDADFVVKLIDVYPDSTANRPETPSYIKLSGFQQLVRGDVIRAKYRNSLSTPEPLVPGEITPVNFELQDAAHTFKKGHKIMVQVQSSWFPLVDRNPNQFIDIYHAKESDYRKATHRIYTDAAQASHLTLKVLQ